MFAEPVDHITPHKSKMFYDVTTGKQALQNSTEIFSRIQKGFLVDFPRFQVIYMLISVCAAPRVICVRIIMGSDL